MTKMMEPTGGAGDVPGPPRVSGRQLRELVADDARLDEVIDQAGQGGVRLTGEGGFLPELVKAVLERGLAVELTDHWVMRRATQPDAGRRTRATARRRRRWRPRSGRSG